MQQPFGIKGVTDSPRAPVVAKAKIGRKTEAGYPEKLDHIIFVEPVTGEPIPAFEALGPEPKSFLGMFPPDSETSVDAAWKRWGKSGLKCRGDGETGIDRETGETLQCAGDYNKDHPENHLCPFARPTTRKGKQQPPECKPMLSMRLVVPLAGALGLVQLDTGGVASSVPTLWWQIEQLRSYSGGQLAGVAIRVGIREFQTKHGTSYAWNLATPTDEELDVLRGQFAAVVPVKVLMPGAELPRLPELTEAVDQDVYGIADEEAIEAADVELVTDEVEEAPAEPETSAAPAVPDEAIAAEENYVAVLMASDLSQARQKDKVSLMQANRTKVAESGEWGRYVDWLNASAEHIAQS